MLVTDKDGGDQERLPMVSFIVIGRRQHETVAQMVDFNCGGSAVKVQGARR